MFVTEDTVEVHVHSADCKIAIVNEQGEFEEKTLKRCMTFEIESGTGVLLGLSLPYITSENEPVAVDLDAINKQWIVREFCLYYSALGTSIYDDAKRKANAMGMDVGGNIQLECEVNPIPDMDKDSSLYKSKVAPHFSMHKKETERTVDALIQNLTVEQLRKGIDEALDSRDMLRFEQLSAQLKELQEAVAN